jgi:hypothetical protein
MLNRLKHKLQVVEDRLRLSETLLTTSTVSEAEGRYRIGYWEGQKTAIQEVIDRYHGWMQDLSRRIGEAIEED